VLSICLLIVVCVRHLAQICVYRHVYEKVALQQSYLLKANVEINQVVLKSCRDVCVYADISFANSNVANQMHINYPLVSSSSSYTN
jgi:hypothetical protein